MRTVTIGTRGSALSLCQTRMVQASLEQRVPHVQFRILMVQAKADQNPEVSLVALGGEGVFVKELETVLIRGEIDLAVHSMKDLPLAIPEPLVVAAVTQREDPRDALISRSGDGLDALPAGARVGTSSLRRRSQLAWQRRDLELVEIRGNVDTRLRKMDEGRYDAVVLAACGLIRLGLEARIAECLPIERMLPEPGQGALGIEARRDDAELLEMLSGLDHSHTRACVEAERAFLGALGGGCRVPIAALAQAQDAAIRLTGAVLSADGSQRLCEQASGPFSSPDVVGRELADRVIARGARELLERIQTSEPRSRDE